MTKGWGPLENRGIKGKKVYASITAKGMSIDFRE